jgi:prolyl oligopeptidase
VSDDGRFLVVSVWKGTDRRNRLYFRDLSKPGAPFVRLFDDFDAAYHFVGNVGTTFTIQTDREAPRQRIVTVEVAGLPEKGAHPALKEIVPQGEGVISGSSMVGGRLLVQVMKDAAESVRIHELDGTFEKEIPLPALGTVVGLAGELSDRETFYAFTSFTYPTTIFRWDFDKGTAETFRRPKVDFDPAAFETERVFYPSADGTKVPMFLVRKKGLAKGNLPTYLYGYGGFNIPMTPGFSSSRIAWLEMGGMYAQACLRGGSEYGEEWHRAGMLDKKQNVFDDFASAARYLVKEGWTTPARIGILGGSNGGLLVGATLNQHPELFGAAVPEVGVMDMLRFHKFTIGWAWVSDYGSADDAGQFKWLYAYSPLHNVKKGAHYPPVMIVTADHDDRVVPAHSFKYAAALQDAQGGEAPILIRIETRAGHGAGKPLAKQIEETADVFAFFTRTLGGLTPPAGGASAGGAAGR